MFKSRKLKIGSVISSVVLWVLVAAPSLGLHLSAAEFKYRTLRLSDSRASATNVTYYLSFDVVSASALGSIELELCDNDPFPGTPCTPPAGLNLSAAVLQQQIGETGFSIDQADTTANKIIFQRNPAQIATPQKVIYAFSGVTNPNYIGGFFGRIRSFASVDASGPATDYGGLAMSTANQFGVSTEVPPYLLFCVAQTFTNGFDCASADGSYANFGELSSTQTKSATSQMIVATNADWGIGITYYGTTMTSGNNIIPAMALLQGSAIGSSQFGINLVNNSDPAVGDDPVGPGAANVTPQYSVANRFKFVNGDAVVASNDVVNFRKFTVSYMVNVSPDQHPGLYSTTIMYICLADF